MKFAAKSKPCDFYIAIAISQNVLLAVVLCLKITKYHSTGSHYTNMHACTILN